MSSDRIDAPRFRELERQLGAAEAEVRLQRARLGTAVVALQQRLRRSAGWLIPASGVAAGLVLAGRRTRGLFAASLALWRLLAGPFAALLGWLAPAATAPAVSAAATADPASAAATPAASPQEAADPH